MVKITDFVSSNKIDAEIDFNKLVVIQMNRCNLALSQGAYQFSTSVLSFSCMLAHLKQRDDIYKKEMTSLTMWKNIEDKKIEGKKNSNILKQEIQMHTSVKEYEMLVRLCARHNLFPAKRGELLTDEEDGD